MTEFNPSIRAKFTSRKAYNRPLSNNETVFESWEDTISRVIEHQRWLWERAVGRKLNESEQAELEELRLLHLDRSATLAGRTLWIGGTDISKKREVSNFNCAFTKVETVYDVVDVFWLLLNGSGVGFKPVNGTLNGFRKYIPQIDVIRSTRDTKGGNEHNVESWDGSTWTLTVGDSALAWARFIGKLIAGKYPADRLVIDLSQIRPAGSRLNGYGWICSGDSQLADAAYKIAQLMNRRAGSLLSKIDIMDIINLLGTVLSSRRSAEICLMDHGDPEAKEFVKAKKDYWKVGNDHRSQSNNSLIFWSKPSYQELQTLFDNMLENGGSEPGFINGEQAQAKAPWFSGMNPCGEIILANKGLCNLCSVDLKKFKGDTQGLHDAIKILARANYRQTLVDLQDEVLQEAWHLNNGFLRLCGVSLAGVVTRDDLLPYDYQELQRTATTAAYSMADELGTERPKNITTVKPDGTFSKIADTTAGAHRPMGRYIFNNIGLSVHDPMVAQMREAGYRVFAKPGEPETVLVTLPVDEGSSIEFDHTDDGKPVNYESAVDQLNRYQMLQKHWNQQNTSITVYYDADEVPDIVDWLHNNWNDYVGVSFMLRPDPAKTAADLGFPYLPQEVVDPDVFADYVSQLREVDFEYMRNSLSLDEVDEDCPSGACPIR